MGADTEVIDIEIAVDRWDLSYSWGIVGPVDSPALPEHMRHGPRFLNALELNVRGEATFHEDRVFPPKRMPAIMRVQEIDGPEPSAHDPERAQGLSRCVQAPVPDGVVAPDMDAHHEQEYG